uniref:Conserved secreted protein n=1 Tax=Elaeophora elaphi TaxID=1147741 RepID=A0A0R3RNN5_9BILA
MKISLTADMADIMSFSLLTVLGLAQLSTANLLAGSNARPTCLTLQGLSPGQARICELFRDHMPAVGAGAKAAISNWEGLIDMAYLLRECLRYSSS